MLVQVKNGGLSTVWSDKSVRKSNKDSLDQIVAQKKNKFKGRRGGDLFSDTLLLISFVFSL